MRNDHKTVGFAWFITQYITDQKVQGQTGMKHLLKHQTRSYIWFWEFYFLRIETTKQNKGKINPDNLI